MDVAIQRPGPFEWLCGSSENQELENLLHPTLQQRNDKIYVAMSWELFQLIFILHNDTIFLLLAPAGALVSFNRSSCNYSIQFQDWYHDIISDERTDQIRHTSVITAPVQRPYLNNVDALFQKQLQVHFQHLYQFWPLKDSILGPLPPIFPSHCSDTRKLIRNNDDCCQI